MYTHPCSPTHSHTYIHTHSHTHAHIYINTHTQSHNTHTHSSLPFLTHIDALTGRQAGRHLQGSCSFPPRCHPQHPVSLGGNVTQAKENRVSHQAWAKLEVREDSPPPPGGKFGKINSCYWKHCPTVVQAKACLLDNKGEPQEKKKWISMPISPGPSHLLVSCTLTAHSMVIPLPCSS